MSDITMPQLSDSMEQGTILTWLKKDGDYVEAGEDLVEIETDKATMTHPADVSGVLRITAQEGTTLSVGAPIAVIGAAPGAWPAEPSPLLPVAEGPIGSGAAEIPETPAGAIGNGHEPSAQTAKATPLARRAATMHGVVLEGMSGSGPGGRVTRDDVLKSAGVAIKPPSLPSVTGSEAHPPPPVTRPSLPLTSAPPPSPSTPSPGAKGTVTIVELTRLQEVVARRMSEVKATVPDFQVQAEVVMDAAIAFRQQIKTAGTATPSLNDLIVKAAAAALRDHPRANSAFRDGRFELYSRINIGIAVAGEDALVVPTIFDADQKSLGTIAAEARRLAARVREAAITPPELSGATFTVSNLGMYGMSAITPVINAPQAAILGVGTTRSHLARVDDEIAEQQLLTLTLSCDHRILYGADAAQFLSDIRTLLEHPLRLAL
jgi:pyruvate dehydrogenase E2 component (dihydrolipoamide acetyltransferase)